MKRMNNCLNLVPYHTIEKAVSGDVNALNRVLKYYEDYIIRLSAGTLYDEYGEQHTIRMAESLEKWAFELLINGSLLLVYLFCFCT